MKKLIKDFVMFPSESYAFNISRDIEPEDDLRKLLDEEYRKHKKRLVNIKVKKEERKGGLLPSKKEENLITVSEKKNDL